MNILIITDEIPYPINNGYKLRVRNFAKYLGKFASVSLFFSNTGHRDENLLELLKNDNIDAFYRKDNKKRQTKFETYLKSARSLFGVHTHNAYMVYSKETGKNAIWRGKESGVYLKWLEGKKKELGL